MRKVREMTRFFAGWPGWPWITLLSIQNARKNLGDKIPSILLKLRNNDPYRRAFILIALYPLPFILTAKPPQMWLRRSEALNITYNVAQRLISQTTLITLVLCEESRNSRLISDRQPRILSCQYVTRAARPTTLQSQSNKENIDVRLAC